MENIERRAFMQGAALGALAFTVGGAEVLLTPQQARAQNVAFRTLSAGEVETLEAVGEALVPGARDAGISHFVDQQISIPPEEALLRAKNDAERANRFKDEFLSTMSHELRTPLNAIMGFSDIMRTRLFGDLPPRYEEYAQLIHESGQHLLDLINDVLDMSKIEAGRIELYLETIDLPHLVWAVHERVGDTAPRHERLDRLRDELQAVQVA